VTLLGQVLIAASVLAVGVVYGTDIFSAIVLRPALAQVDDRTLVSTMGRVHDFGDRRLRLPGIAGLVNARLKGAAQRGEVPADTRQLQQRWDSVIDARSGLQMLAVLALCTALITA